MKKNELTVGMQVESAYGRVGTVIDVSGWTKPGPWSTNTTTVVWEGQRLDVNGYHGGPGVLVLWNDHNGGPTTWPRIEQAKQLHPIGTYAAMRAAEDEEDAREKAWQSAEANEVRGQLRVLWGDRTDALLAALSIPTEGPLDQDQRAAADIALTCGGYR